MVQPDAAAHLCKVQMSLAADLPAFEGDPIQIQQAVINLVRNAFDAMRDVPPGRRIVEIATHYNGDGAIGVAVRDYGSGISEPTVNDFSSNSLPRRMKAWEWALPLSRSIVEAHGGTISAENADGGGARFYFRLPINEGTSQ